MVIPPGRLAQDDEKCATVVGALFASPSLPRSLAGLPRVRVRMRMHTTHDVLHLFPLHD
jgi:hypothetical protein